MAYFKPTHLKCVCIIILVIFFNKYALESTNGLAKGLIIRAWGLGKDWVNTLTRFPKVITSRDLSGGFGLSKIHDYLDETDGWVGGWCLSR